MSTPPNPLTRADLLKMSTADLKKIVSDPAKLAEVNAALLAQLATPSETPETPETSETPAVTPEVPAQTPEEIAVAEEAARKAETDRLAAEAAAKAEEDRKKAEQEMYKAAGVTVETDANGNIVKIIKTYQARDEAGNPIGRPTYLEAKSWVELSVKQQSAHENAVRFAERLKKTKLTVKKDGPEPVQTLSEEELLKLQDDLKSEDREKAAKAAEQVRVNDERKRLKEADEAIENARQAKESYEFLAAHPEFYRCEANIKLLTDYIKDNNFEWNKSNLEAALLATESQQAPREPVAVPSVVPAPPVPPNPAPVAPAVVTPPPVAPAPPAPPVAPNPPAPPAARPGVNAGLVPGQGSGLRPTNQPKGLTKADIAKMPREEYRRRLRDPKFVAEVNAVLAKK